MTLSKEFNQVLVDKSSAIILRRLGHNAWCDCYYHTDNEDEDDYEMGNNQICNDNFQDYHERVAAPYVTDALLWLIQFNNIAVDITHTINHDHIVDYDVKIYFGKVNNECVMAKNNDIQKAIRDAIHYYLLKVEDSYINNHDTK